MPLTSCHRICVLQNRTHDIVLHVQNMLRSSECQGQHHIYVLPRATPHDTLVMQKYALVMHSLVMFTGDAEICSHDALIVAAANIWCLLLPVGCRPQLHTLSSYVMITCANACELCSRPACVSNCLCTDIVQTWISCPIEFGWFVCASKQLFV